METRKPSLADGLRQLGRESASHPTHLDLLALAMDELDRDRQGLLEDHLLECEPCRQRFKDLQCLPEEPFGSDQAPSEKRVDELWESLQSRVAEEKKLKSAPGPFRYLAAAASLTLMCGAFWIGQWTGEVERPTVVAVTALSPAHLTRAESATDSVNCPDPSEGSKSFVLLLPVEPEGATAPYDVVIKIGGMPESEERLKFEGVRAHGLGQLAIQIPFDLLPDGDHAIEVESTEGSPTRFELRVNCRRGR